MSSETKKPSPPRKARAWLFASLILTFAIQVLAGDGTLESTRKSVVVLGDSLAAGLGVRAEQSFPSLLQGKIDEAGWDFAVVNAGVSGDTTAGGLGRIDWLLKRKIDVLILELGGNDGLRGIPVSATRTNLQGIIDRVKQKDSRTQIILAGMQMPANMGEEYTEAFRKLYPELAARNGIALIPFLLEGVGGKPELNQNDRIHPNAEGHRIVAENVWNILRPVLEKVRAADRSRSDPQRRAD